MLRVGLNQLFVDTNSLTTAFTKFDMDRFPLVPSGNPLLDSLRSSLLPGWPLPVPFGPGLPTLPMLPAPVVSLGALSQSSATVSSSAPSVVEQPTSTTSDATRAGRAEDAVRSDDVIVDEGTVEDDDDLEEEEDEEDQRSDRTDPAMTSAGSALSSPSLPAAFPVSPGSLLEEGRRHSTGQSSKASSSGSLCGKKRVTCDVCGKTYCDKGALKIHTSAVHLKEMQMCTVPGCLKEFTSRRSRNRHSKNKNMKLHTSDPSKLAALTAMQEQSRILATTLPQLQPTSPTIAGAAAPRKRKAPEGVLDLSLPADDVIKPSSLPLPLLPAPPLLPSTSVGMHFLLLQQLMQNQLYVQSAFAVTSPPLPPTTREETGDQ